MRAGTRVHLDARSCGTLTAMPLEEYRRKRDFGKTPEPAPDLDTATSGKSGRFVVQRHRATRLHYDFRLEIDGVLVSWAVPKGPTLDSKVRRMAVHVEDHPIEYFDFEGIIPAKQYGAGDVIVWDWGTWDPEAPTLEGRKAVQDGELKFRLNGEKLKGRFTIVRTSGRGGSRPFEADDGDQWLLIHKNDDAASPGWDAEDHPQSVKTGRTNDEVKENRDAIWISQSPAATAEIDLAGAKTAPLPQKIEPMLATLATKPFDDDDWLFEIKWDGFRVQSVVDDGKVRILTRNLNDASTYFPRLLGSPGRWIEAQQAIIDGEVVAIDDDGRSDFSLLQTKLGDKEANGLVYEAFDLLYLDGRSLLDVPLEDRKRLLRSVLKDHPRVRFASHVVGEGKAFFEAASTLGVEGMVAKLRRSRYEPGKRTGAWLKIKIRPEQDFVVGGWTPGSGNARDLGALAIGVYEGDKLRFAGKVGSGFTGAIRNDLLKRLKPLVQDDPPFDPAPPKDYRGRWGGDLRDITWVSPELVIRAEIGGWTRDGQVRQTAYKGIEAGRDPTAVAKEMPVATTTAVRAAEAAEPAPPEEEPMPSKNAKSVKAAKPAESAKSGKSGKVGKPRQSCASRAEPPASSTPEFAGPTPDELAELEALGKEGVWHIGGRELKLTNLDKPLFEGRPGPDGKEEPPVTKRELIRYFATIAPTMLPHLVRPSAQPAALPERRRRARVLAEGHPRDRTEMAEALARDRRRRTRGSRRQRPPAGGRRRQPRLARQPGQLRGPRLDRQAARAVAAGVRLHRHRPGREDDLGGDAHARPAVSGRARAPRRARLSQDDGQARHPGLDPDRPRHVRLLRDEPVGGTGIQGGRLDRARPDLVGVGQGGSEGSGAARLHPERVDQDARRAVFGATRAGRAGERADLVG